MEETENGFSVLVEEDPEVEEPSEPDGKRYGSPWMVKVEYYTKRTKN